MNIWIPIIGFFCAFTLHIAALKVFPTLGLLDFPERYQLTRKRLPYPTGILSVITFVLIVALTTTLNTQAIGLLLGVTILGIISFVDDRFQIHWSVRLLVQIGIAIALFATGTRIYTLTNPLEGFAGFDGLINLDTIDIQTSLFGPLPFWSGVFTVMWLLLTMNALNWFDGISGQVSVLSVIGFITIGILSLSARVNQPELAQLAFLLAAISAASVLFDFPPNKVVLGDSGAMFFGLLLGVLTIYAGGKVATGFLVLGVPLMDVFFVVTRRMLKRSPLTKGTTSGEHIHHRLRSKNWSDRSIIFFTASIGTVFGVTALFLSTQGKLISGMLLLLFMIGISIYSTPAKHG